MRKPRRNEIAIALPPMGLVLGCFEMMEHASEPLNIVWVGAMLGVAGALGLPLAFVALSREDPWPWLSVVAIVLNMLAVMPAAMCLSIYAYLVVTH